MGEVFQELKRRNIFRVAVAYVVLGWVLLQAVGLIAPGLGLPDWTFPFIFLLLVIGFPIALIFAWAFELTPEGLKRTTDVHPEHSLASSTGRKLDLIIIGILSLALILLLIDRLFTDPRTSPDVTGVAATGPWSSIAVLPFTNMSGDPNQEYFSDGVSEELLNVLAKAEGLRVAARTSSFSFKDKDTGVQEIGSLLNVDTVLEGSVRKSGTKLRITAQLIDVATGYHIWSETYDRKTRDIFDIQDEIAWSIASAMSAHLVGLDEAAEPKHRPDLEAYNLYLAGRHLMKQRTPESAEKAFDVFDQAIARDPLFASAYANKAEAISMLTDTVTGMPPEAVSQALSLTETALRLDPDLAEAFAVRGLLYLDSGEHKKAIVELERAISLNPNLAEAHLWLGINYALSGRQGDALSEYELAYELDPLHPIILNNFAIKLSDFERYEEANALLDKKELIDTSPRQRARTLAMRIDHASLRGNIAEAYRLFLKFDDPALEGAGFYARFNGYSYLSLKESGEAFDPMPKRTMVWLSVLQGKSGEARSILDTISKLEQNERPLSYAEISGCVLALEGDFKAATVALEKIPYRLISNIANYSTGTWFAWSLIETGRQQEANRLLNDIMNQVADQRKIQGAYWRIAAQAESEVYILRGDNEKAIDLLEDAYDHGIRYRVWRHHPLYAPIREHPRFVALFDKIDEDFKVARIEAGLGEPSKLEGPN